jgi:Leucine-rich repeat (LRR) protein
MHCLLLLLVTGCSNYDFTINDKVVYTPDPLFTDFDIPDEALRACVKKAITDQKVTRAGALVRLDCRGAGIETLAGLSTFNDLESLTLSSNDIVDIGELAALTILQSLDLDHNRVIDPVPLYQLPALSRLDLSNNPDLICPASGSLLRVADVTLPRHCR